MGPYIIFKEFSIKEEWYKTYCFIVTKYSH